jgi:hypothetical protein
MGKKDAKLFIEKGQHAQSSSSMEKTGVPMESLLQISESLYPDT